MNKVSLETFEEATAAKQEEPKVKRPRRFKVILLNDDYTPMEFVVLVLKKMFFMDEGKATKIMLQVHTQGKGVCGVYTKDVAETKAVQVNDFARLNEHPLCCDMEPE